MASGEASPAIVRDSYLYSCACAHVLEAVGLVQGIIFHPSLTAAHSPQSRTPGLCLSGLGDACILISRRCLCEANIYLHSVGMDSGVSLAHQRLDGGPAAAFPRLRQDVDGLQRELRNANNEIARVKSLYNEKENQCTRMESALRLARKNISELEAMQNLLAQEKGSAVRDRDAALRKAEEANAYTKKLETKILAGKGEYLVEQNLKLKDAVSTLRGDNDDLRKSVDDLKAELEKATKEIEVLATALELRADELAIDGDLRAGLLFEVAHRREESKNLEVQLSSLRSQVETKDFENKELRAQLQHASSDVAMLSDRNSKLSADLSSSAASRAELESRLRAAEQERDVGLDFVADQSAKLADALLKAEQAHKRAMEAQRGLQESESALSVQQSEFRRLKSSLETAHTGLVNARDAQGSAEKRASTAETDCAAMRGEISSLRAQVAALSAANEKAQMDLSARAQEAATAQAHGRAAQAEASALHSQLTAEQQANKTTRSALEERIDKLSSEVRASNREKEEVRGQCHDARAKLTVSNLEIGRLNQQLVEANATIANMKSGWTEAQARMVGQVTELRELLAEEQALRHEEAVEFAHRDAVRSEAAKQQRSADRGRAQPKKATGPDVNTSFNSQLSSPGRGPIKAHIVPRSAQVAASLVRDALMAHGLDPGLADEYLSARVRPTEVTVPQPFQVGNRSPARYTRPHESSGSTVGRDAVQPPPAPPAGPGPMSPGHEALEAARARVRARTQVQGQTGISYDAYLGTTRTSIAGSSAAAAHLPLPILSADDLTAAYENTVVLPQ